MTTLKFSHDGALGQIGDYEVLRRLLRLAIQCGGLREFLDGPGEAPR